MNLASKFLLFSITTYNLMNLLFNLPNHLNRSKEFFITEIIIFPNHLQATSISKTLHVVRSDMTLAYPCSMGQLLLM